jgi:hypothetical protein
MDLQRPCSVSPSPRFAVLAGCGAANVPCAGTNGADCLRKPPVPSVDSPRNLSINGETLILRIVALALALGLITSYTVAVIPPNRPARPNEVIRTEHARAGTQDDVADGFAPIRQRTRWRDTYFKGFYNDPARGLVVAIPTPESCHQMLRTQSYTGPVYGRCGTGLPRTCNYQIEEWGWPMRCTWCWWKHGDKDGYAEGRSVSADLGTPRAYPWSQPTVKIPYGILWGGLAVNTAAFASAWFLVLMFPRAASRLLRSKPGGCGTCGYDLHGLPKGAPCPECGAAIQ